MARPKSTRQSEVKDGATRRFQRKREAILDAAARLFNQKGVRGATLTAVAQAVGLIPNSVTYYYRKKEDLAVACFLRAIEAMETLIAQAGAHRDPRLRVAALFTGYADTLAAIARGEHSELVLFNDIRALPPPHGDMVFAGYTDMFRHIRGLIDDSSLSRLELNGRAQLLLALLHSMRTLTARFEPEDYRAAAERVVDIVLDGLAAPGQIWRSQGLAPDVAPAHAEASAEAFLRAATQLINEQGYRGASVERISARLNVTKGSFYHHNDNKDDLVAQCFARTFDVVRRRQNEARELDGSGWTRLCAATEALTRYQLGPEGPLLRITAMSALPETIREDVETTMARLSERFGMFIVDGMIDGSIRPVDPSIAAQCVNATINAAAALERWAPGAAPDNAAEILIRPLLVGLYPRGQAASKPRRAATKASG